MSSSLQKFLVEFLQCSEKVLKTSIFILVSFQPKYSKNELNFTGKLGAESCGAWGHYKTGTITLCVEDGLEKIKKGTCEELFLHECTHVTVDPLVLNVGILQFIYCPVIHNYVAGCCCL